MRNETAVTVAADQIGRRIAPTGCVLVVAGPDRASRYPTGSLTRLAAHTTHDAIAAIEQRRPVVVVIEWDFAPVDKAAICRMAAIFPTVTILASIADASSAPAAIKAGCHAILLEPIEPQLALMRIARLSQAGPARGTPRANVEPATYQLYAHVACPSCAVRGAASFEMATRRTRWFACLQCDHVWTARPVS